jgi:hypothetical protein
MSEIARYLGGFGYRHGNPERRMRKIILMILSNVPFFAAAGPLCYQSFRLLLYLKGLPKQ